VDNFGPIVRHAGTLRQPVRHDPSPVSEGLKLLPDEPLPQAARMPFFVDAARRMFERPRRRRIRMAC